MRRASALFAALAAAALVASISWATLPWTSGQDAAGHPLIGLPHPVDLTSPIVLGDLPSAGLPCVLVVQGASPFWRCATSGDLQPPLADATGSLIFPSSGQIRVRPIGAFSLFGNSTNSAAVGQDVGIDSTLTLGSATLGRAAVGGVITINAASNTSTFTPVSGLSLYANAGTTTAAPTLVSATAPLQALMENGAGTGIGFQAIPYSAITGTPVGAASWDPSVFRVYALDYDAGNDSNAGFATAASSSLADFETADQAAGAVALKTMQGLGTVLPRQGNGRKVAIIIASRSGGASYLKQDGVTVDTLDSFMSGTVGYGQVLIWGTGTNATCGATKFHGDAADFTCAGGIIVPGTNASGYNPTAGATTASVPATKVGGGAPGLPAEPLAPLGYSTRYDVGTLTASLRNVARATAIVSTTSTSNDTVSPQSPWPATPTTSDIFYLEQPGVVCNGWGASWDTNSRITIVGVRALTLTNYAPGPVETTSLKHMFDGFGGSSALATVSTGIAALSQIDPGTGVGTITRGSTIHAAGAVVLQPGTFPQLSSMVTEGTTILEFMYGGFEDKGSVFGGTVTFQGMQASLIPNNPFLGNVTPGPTQIQDRVIAGHVVVDGGWVNLRDVQITGAGSSAAISVVGKAAVYLNGPTGSSGNSDVGLDLTAAQGSQVVLNTTPSVTGSAGDVRICDSTIVTWAQAAGLVDACGNTIVGPSGFPFQATASGPKLPQLAGAGTRTVTADPSGVLSTGGVPAVVQADGILTGTVQLASVSAATLAAGTVASVTSVDDYFALLANTQTPDNLTIVAASGKAGYNWIRLGLPSTRAAGQAAWYLDPANSSGHASDENDGKTSSTPLRTLSEHSRRLNRVLLTASTTFNLMSSQQAGDLPVYSYRLPSTSGTAYVTFLGTPTVLYAGTVTSFTYATLGGGHTDDNRLVDNSIPSSFTASGLMADGVLFTRTGNPTIASWYAAKDLGSKTLRTSWVMDWTHVVLNNPTVSPGDTYVAELLPTITSLAITDTNPAALATQFQHINFAITANGVARFPMWAVESTFSTRFDIPGPTVFYNCMWSNVSLLINLTGGYTMTGGLMRATSPHSLGISNGGRVNFEGNQPTFQGVNITNEQSAVASFDIYSYDVPSGLASLHALTDGTWGFTTAGSGISGSGNTGAMLAADTDGKIRYNGGTPANAASTSATQPFSIGLVPQPVGNYPVDSAGNGIWDLTQESPFLRDPGGTGVVVANGSGSTTARTLATDGTITIVNPSGVPGAPTFSRPAIGGAIVIGTGSNTATQGVGATTSLLGVAGSSTTRADIACSGDGNVFWDNAGTVGCSPLPYTKISGAPAIPSGTGFEHVTGGVLDGTARAVNLATADITGKMPINDLDPTGAGTGWLPTWNGSAVVWQAPAAPGVGTVTNVSGTAGQINVVNNTTTPIISLPNVGPGAVTTGGTGIASITTDAQGRVVSAATANYQTALSFPAANQITYSTSVGLAGDPSLTFDPSGKGVNIQWLDLNGLTDPGNVFLLAGHTTTSNRDRAQLYVGGGGLGPTGTGDSTFVDVIPSTTAVRGGVTGGIYSTVRARAVTYTGSGQTISEAAGGYFESPSLSGVSGIVYALHAVGPTLVTGDFGVTGIENIQTLAGFGRGIVVNDSFGQLATTGNLGAGILTMDSGGNVASTAYGTVGASIGAAAVFPFTFNELSTTNACVGWIDLTNGSNGHYSCGGGAPLSPTAVEWTMGGDIPQTVRLQVHFTSATIIGGDSITIYATRNGSTINPTACGFNSSSTPPFLCDQGDVSVASGAAASDSFGVKVVECCGSNPHSFGSTVTLRVLPY